MKDPLIALIPTQADVDGLEVGSQALNCFGRWSEVVRISYRGVDVHGKAFVGYDVRFGDRSTISGSYKVGELVSHAALGTKFNAAETRTLAAEMTKAGERLREIAA